MTKKRKGFFSKVKDEVEETVDNVVEEVKDFAEDVVEEVKEIKEDIVEGVTEGEDLFDAVSDAVKEAVNDIGEDAKDLADNVGDAADDLVEEVQKHIVVELLESADKVLLDTIQKDDTVSNAESAVRASLLKTLQLAKTLPVE